jgi:DNA-binding NarL/FixJ family response regulator
MRAGAEGYVLKLLASLKEMLDAVRGVLGGEFRYPYVLPRRSLLRKRANRGSTGNPLGFR